MKPFLTILVLLSTAFIFICSGQTKTYTGKIIDFFDLLPLPETAIYYNDEVLLGKSNLKGIFSITVPVNAEKLSLRSLGYEEANIQVPPGCDTLEIIMIPASTYDFMTSNKINRLRYRDFKRLSKKHIEAYQKGIFNTNKPCFVYIFRK